LDVSVRVHHEMTLDSKGSHCARCGIFHFDFSCIDQRGLGEVKRLLFLRSKVAEGTGSFLLRSRLSKRIECWRVTLRGHSHVEDVHATLSNLLGS